MTFDLHGPRFLESHEQLSSESTRGSLPDSQEGRGEGRAILRSGYAATLATSGDRVSADHLPACPDCGDLAHPSATLCESCGGRLFPGTALAHTGDAARPQQIVIGCTCGGNDLCTACVLASYDRETPS